MGFRWENGRLVDDSVPAVSDSEQMLTSLLDRRERLQETTKSKRSLFDRTIGAVVRAPGISQALDVLSRPSYAVNEALASAIDPNKRGGVGGSFLDAAVGAGRGLWGTQKTSNIETLREGGKEGALYTALGLTADIALDPLTYFGAAPLKAVGTAAKSAKGTKVLSEVLEKSRNIDDVKKFNYVADPADKVQTALRMNLDRINAGKTPLKGQELTNELAKKLDELAEERALKKLNDDIAAPYGIAKRSATPKAKARKEVLEMEKARAKYGIAPYTARQRNAKVNELASAEALSIARAAQVAAEGAVEVKRAGLKLRFGPVSTELRADNALVSAVVDQPKVRNTATKIVNSSLVQDLNKKFRTEGTYGKVFNESRKLNNAQGVSSYDTLRLGKIADAGDLSIDDVVRGLTEKEAKAFYRAFELGDLSQVPEQFKSGLLRDDVAKLVTKINDNFWDAEVEAGLIPLKRDEAGNLIVDEVTGRPVPAVEKVDNYLYHRVIKGRKEAAKLKNKAYTRAVAKDTLESAVERTFKTAEDAKKFGVEIDTDLRTALLNRTAKHTQAMARRNFITDAVDNFGIKIADDKTLKMMKADGHDLVKLKSVLADAKKGAALEYLDDSMYIPREFADKLKGIETIANDPGPFLSLMDSVLRRWKPAVTVYNPGHHLRNFTSDVFLGYMDGVKNPRYYYQAAEIVIDKKLGGHLNIGKGKLRKDQVIKLFHETGASPNFIQTEVAMQGAGNKISRGVRKVAQDREEIARMAHYLHAFKEEAAGIAHNGVVTQEVIDAAQRASSRVKKWHLDYSDLTDFEKVVMKRVTPFYTWMRKSTPLMIEAMVLRPGKVLNFDRTFDAMFQALGAEPGEGLPQDQIPGWIREQVYGQIGMSDRGNPLIMTPSVPYAEPFAWTDNGFTGALRQGLASLNPVLKAPIELGLGTSTFTGAPMQGGVGQYATGLIPVGRQISNMIGTKDPESDTGNTKLINWLTGAGIQEITPKAQRGEIRRQIDMLEGKLAEMGKEYPYAQNSSNTAPKAAFVWENGKLVKKG